MTMQDGGREGPLYRLAKRQDGVFSRQQAMALGVTDDMLRRRTTKGDWERVRSGVYLLPSHPWGWRQRNHAALLTNPEGALSGLTASRVYGLPDVPRHDGVNLVVPSGAHVSSRFATVHRSSLIRPRLIDGFRTNALPLVMREIAADAPDALPALFENAVLRRRLRPDQVAEVAVAASARRMAGARVLRDLLTKVGDGMAVPQSVLERFLYAMLNDPTLPSVTGQAPAPWSAGKEFVDALLDAWRMIVEGDGRLWHARLAAMENDRRRDHEAQRLGIIVVRFGYVELRDDPAGCRRHLIETARSFGRIPD